MKNILSYIDDIDYIINFCINISLNSKKDTESLLFYASDRVY